jgi:hypothetical protein
LGQRISGQHQGRRTLFSAQKEAEDMTAPTTGATPKIALDQRASSRHGRFTSTPAARGVKTLRWCRLGQIHYPVLGTKAHGEPRFHPLVAGVDCILFSDALVAEGARVFAKACELGLEGIVSKRAGSRYSSGNSRQWLKSKNPEFERT